MDKKGWTHTNPIKANCHRSGCRSREGHRYFVGCHLVLEDWDRRWQVTFVDDEESLGKWLDSYTPVVFDCEASYVPRRLGLLQLATSKEQHQVLVIDATSKNINWTKDGKNIKRVFQHRLAGFSIGRTASESVEQKTGPTGDKMWLENRGVDEASLAPLRDLQNKKPSTHCFDNFTKTKTSLSLDDFSECLLGRRSKIQLKKNNEEYLPGWAWEKWKLSDTEIHYAANDVVALACMLPLLDST